MEQTPAIPPGSAHADVARVLESDSYTRERWEPRRGDSYYLMLSDLRRALESFKSDARLVVLDYGCGSSPYRSLFKNAEYRRADFVATTKLDYQIQTGLPLAEKDGTFDLILSTQVLEHVQYPGFYLRECRRLLAPGGLLVLSTHGSFPDHGCPHDFQRWTVDGLKRDLRESGLHTLEAKKLTTGSRAVLFFLEQYAEVIVAPRHTTFGFLFGVMRRLIRSRREGFHTWVDQYFESLRVADAASENSEFYVSILMVAEPLKERP